MDRLIKDCKQNIIYICGSLVVWVCRWVIALYSDVCFAGCNMIIGVQIEVMVLSSFCSTSKGDAIMKKDGELLEMLGIMEAILISCCMCLEFLIVKLWSVGLVTIQMHERWNVKGELTSLFWWMSNS